MELNDLISQIGQADRNVADKAKGIWDSLAKPLGSLGRFEDAIIQVAALRGDADVQFKKRVLLVFCADNGVVAQGVTQCGSDVTASVALALAAGDSTVCHMARAASCDVLPVDMGIRAFSGADGVLDRRIRNGTEDITLDSAMTREECVRAILAGAELVRTCKEQGYDVIAVGEMGIGNTTTCTAVTSVLLGLPPEEITSRGAGLSDDGLTRKIHAIRQAIRRSRPDAADPVDVIAKVGGLDIAAMCGAFLGGAAYRVPMLIDGVISSVAALCAVMLCPAAADAMLASHLSAAAPGELVMRKLGKTPLITADMRLGEGSGAVMLLPLLDMALSVYHSGHTFGALGIDAYTPQ